MAEPLYRIMELTTTDWTEVDYGGSHLTKEECDRRLEELMSDGVPPARLKVQRIQ